MRILNISYLISSYSNVGMVVDSELLKGILGLLQCVDRSSMCPTYPGPLINKIPLHLSKYAIYLVTRINRKVVKDGVNGYQISTGIK